MYAILWTFQRAQELVNIEAYREWALIGYLVCPTELLRPGAVDIASVSCLQCKLSCERSILDLV